MTIATVARKPRCPVILLLVIAGLLFVAVPPLSQHALDRHGDNAVLCREAIIGCDPEKDDYFEGVTDEGSIYRILRLEREGKRTVWVLFITVALGITAAGKVRERTVTAYTVRNKSHIEALKRRCK